jgi:ATP adenylyltransferase
MKFLLAPWRWDFISNSIRKKGCIFCEALKMSDKDALICFRGKKFFIILNKYPYNTGHLMVVPYKHLDSPQKVTPGDSLEMWNLMNQSLEILKAKFKPDGFNMGMNLGGSAGAGVKEHFHLHVVPRWSGDSNFMVVTSNTKVVSYSIENIHSILLKEFNS